MITRTQALKAQHGEEVYSMRRGYPVNADGIVEPRRATISGRCRTWRSHPDAFRLPIKLGRFRTSEIDHTNQRDWTFDKQEAIRALNPLGPVHPVQGSLL